MPRRTRYQDGAVAHDTWSRGGARHAVVVLASLLALSSCSSADDSDDAGEVPDVREPTATIEASVAEDELDLSAEASAQEDENPDASSEFIDLPYWEGFLIDEYFSLTVQPEEECPRPEPDVMVCDYEMTASLVGTQIGHSTEIQTGTRTTYFDETCPGSEEPGSARLIQDGIGTITSAWGDTLDFRVRQGCGLTQWFPEGGTGRFEGASGLMSGVVAPPIPGFGAVNVGTLTVRAELWADLFPPVSE